MIHKFSEKMPQRVHKCSADDPRIHFLKSTLSRSRISECSTETEGYTNAGIVCGGALELLQ